MKSLADVDLMKPFLILSSCIFATLRKLNKYRTQQQKIDALTSKIDQTFPSRFQQLEEEEWYVPAALKPKSSPVLPF